MESTKRGWNRRREDGIDEERMESTKRRRNRRREDGIDEEKMESTKRRWNRRREDGIDEERMESIMKNSLCVHPMHFSTSLSHEKRILWSF
ncbi:hypothetical protein JNO66_06180 [Bacillus gibsonii]|nr:hypothetical protein [Alkalicoccobacillus gibsonii]